MFIRTTKDNRHTHVAYLYGDEGRGQTSVDKDHTHEIELQQAADAVTDETGAVVTEAVDGGWVFTPGPNGHFHEIAVQLLPKQATEDKKTDAEKVKMVRDLFSEAQSIEGKFREEACKAERFYEGDQWAKKDADYLEDRDRAHLTINEIEPKLDTLSGFFRQNRTDIKYFPLEDGDSKIADIATVVVKNITEQNNFVYEETAVFEDKMIVGRGLLNTRVTHDTNLEGDIVIEKFPWDEAWLGAHDRLDLKDCEYLIKARWLSWARVKQQWPDKKDEIQKEIDVYLGVQAACAALNEDNRHQFTSNHYDRGEGFPVALSRSTDLIDVARKEYRVLESWHKVYRKAHVLVNAIADVYENAEGWPQADINAVKTIPGFAVVPRVITEMQVTQVAGGTVLNDDKDPWFEGEFSLIADYAKKRKGKIWGKVKGAIGMQEEINKRHSQTIDIMNKVAAYGWFIEDTMFSDGARGKRNFKKDSSSPGFVVSVTDINKLPQQIDGIKFPNEIVALETMATDKLREIMNISPELQGFRGKTISGVALVEQKRQGLTGNEFLFDNSALAKRQLGRRLLRLVQKLYTPDRILRVIGSQQARHGDVEIGGKPLAENDMDEIRELLEKADLTKYDVAVGESSNNPTTKHGNFLTWAELSKTHPDTIPLELLVALSDIPDKDKWLKAIGARQEEIQQENEATRQTEIVKTQIANQGRTGEGG